MAATRREVLQLASAGLGSLAVLGIASGQTGKTNPKGKKLPNGKFGPGITIDNIYSGMTLGQSFTVVGTYDTGGVSSLPITCDIMNEGDSGIVTSDSGNTGRWQADFSGVLKSSSQTITAKFTGAALPKAEVTDITISADPGNGLGIDSIEAFKTDLSKKIAKGELAKTIGYKPTGKGSIKDYEAIVATYYGTGIEVGTRWPVSVKGNNWKENHEFDTTTDKDKKVSFVVTALIWDDSRKAFRLFQVSKSNLQVG